MQAKRHVYVQKPTPVFISLLIQNLTESYKYMFICLNNHINRKYIDDNVDDILSNFLFLRRQIRIQIYQNSEQKLVSERISYRLHDAFFGLYYGRPSICLFYVIRYAYQFF